VVKLVRKFEGLRFSRPLALRPSAGASCPSFNHPSCYSWNSGEAILKIPYRNVFFILSYNMGFREDGSMPMFFSSAIF